ncbi:hypothetical protein GJ496_003753 [Pomphorhynchus laevis]|nr:hypothetical protein GJ496_003753 [Pomphorhynchus laevis]
MGFGWQTGFTNILSFSNDLDIISNILRSIFSKNHLQCIPVLIACNKQDAELDRESMSIREVMIIPCSAYGHQGISEGFHWLVQSILKK